LPRAPSGALSRQALSPPRRHSAKALGIGLVAPATLPSIGVAHDALGRPRFAYAEALAAHLAARRLVAHLSISDETDFAVAFVVMEFT
jgi:holo-[acyl-carrier protein] synthase